MRLLDTNVKYFDTNSYGVPKLKNSWGSIIEFLDAALVDGSDIILSAQRFFNSSDNQPQVPYLFSFKDWAED